MIGSIFYRWTNGNLTLHKFGTGNRRKAGWRPFGFLKEICRPGSRSSSWLESRIERSERRASWLVITRRYTTQVCYWKSGTEPWANIDPWGTVQLSLACLIVGGLEVRCLNTIDASLRLSIQSLALPTQDKTITLLDGKRRGDGLKAQYQTSAGKFYPPKGDAKHIQSGSNCFYLCFILG